MTAKGWYKTQAQQNTGQLHEIERTDNNIKTYRVQIFTEDTPDNKLIVKSVIPGGPSDKAGVNAGDIILSVDGIKITKDEFLPLMTRKQKGEHVVLVVERNNKIINFDIEPREFSDPTDFDKIRHLLGDKKKVVLAIIIGQITNAMPNSDTKALEVWESGTRNNLQNELENYWLKAKKNATDKAIANNFSIVDRSRVDGILNQYLLSELDFVSDKIRAKIGYITGATHLLLIEFGRSPYQNSGAYTDILNKRLIDVTTGEVLAISTAKVTMGW